MPASHAKAAELAARRTRAINLRIAGVQWAQIATACGYSSAAHAAKDIARASDQAMVEQAHTADQYRHLNTLRLERLLGAVWAGATATVAQGGVNIAMVDASVRIIDRLSKLHGLDQAQKIQITSVDALDAAIADLEAQQALLDQQALDTVDGEWFDEYGDDEPLALPQGAPGNGGAATG